MLVFEYSRLGGRFLHIVQAEEKTVEIDAQITFRKLEVFLCFMEQGNMNRVAESLGQSTVSVHRALHSLEAGLGCPLFRLEGKKLVPLAAAHVFAEHARRAVKMCSEGVQKAREAAGLSAARLRIGALYSLTIHTLPQVLMQLKVRRPDLDVDLTLSSNRELLDQCREGRLDAIIIALHEPVVPSDLVAIPLFEDAMYFAAPLDSPYTACTEIDLRALHEETFVSLDEGFATYQDARRIFEHAGFEPKVTMRVGDIFSLGNLVGGGVGYALLPGRMAAFSTRIQLIPLKHEYAASQQIMLLLPKNRERDANLLALSAECRMFRRKMLDR